MATLPWSCTSLAPSEHLLSLPAPVPGGLRVAKNKFLHLQHRQDGLRYYDVGHMMAEQHADNLWQPAYYSKVAPVQLPPRFEEGISLGVNKERCLGVVGILLGIHVPDQKRVRV